MKKLLYYKKIYILLLLLSSRYDVYSQLKLMPLEGRLTQYTLQKSFVNPAVIGSYDALSASVYYRNQWTGIKGAPKTQGLDFSIPMNNKNNLGIQLIRDNIAEGYKNNYNINIIYAHRIQLTKTDFLSFGIDAGADEIVSNYSSLRALTAGDPMLLTATETTFVPNLKLGAYYFRSRLYAGFALNNIFFAENNTSAAGGYKMEYFNWQKIQYVGHGGAKIYMSEYWDMDLSTLGRYKAGTSIQVDINAMFLYDNVLGIGATYRTNKEVAIMSNISFLEHFKLGYSYGVFLQN